MSAARVKMTAKTHHYLLFLEKILLPGYPVLLYSIFPQPFMSNLLFLSNHSVSLPKANHFILSET